MRIPLPTFATWILLSLVLTGCNTHSDESIIHKIQAGREASSLVHEELDAEIPSAAFTNNSSLCEAAQTLDACDRLLETCQPVFLDHSDEESEDSFSRCLAKSNPELFRPEEVKLKLVDASAPAESFPPETVAPDQLTISTILEGIKDPAPEDCQSADPKHLVGKNQIMICQQTETGSHHTIVVSCKTLYAHSQNHQDYLGACF